MRLNETRARTPRGIPGVLAVALLVTLGALGSPGRSAAGDDIIITLKNRFIEDFKNRVTIDTTFSVDAVPSRPHKIGKGGDDGDMHFSGRAQEVELPIVAEIMNARGEPAAMRLVRQQRGKGPVKVVGAWRLWCEHANTSKQVQGEPLEPFPAEQTNPDHVFEVHPVTRLGDMPLLDTIGGIDGYQYKDATEAFNHIDNVKCHIRPNADATTTLRTGSVGYNYIEFILESLEAPPDHLVVNDGRFFRAAVRDTEGELLNRGVRMVFIKDTDAEQAAQKLPKGGRLHVVGVPRIDLALVSWRVRNKDNPKFKDDEPLDWNLPYELVVVGVLGPE
jgi:hypothetical protein